MRLPRDLFGQALIRLLRLYGYERTRQVGSDVRLQSDFRGHMHHVTVPDRDSLRVGTLKSILSDVADYLSVERSKPGRELFQ